MNRRRYLVAFATTGAAVAGAGCTDAGDDSTPIDGESPTAGGSPTDGQPSDSTATASPTESRTATPTLPSDPDQRVAVGDGLQFDPDAFEVTVGDTVLWEWVGAGHNVKYDEGAVPASTEWTGTEGSRTTTYGEGHAHWHTFATPGEYEYYCVPHRSSGMAGSFTVVE